MKINIGPHRSWIGPYQLADLLKVFGVSEDRCHSIGEWLSNTPLLPVCQWIDKRKKRKVKIRIEKYDTWNMDSTLALIILPMLRQLKETKHGSPNVDDTDVPKHLRSTSAQPKENEWDTDANWHARWDWVMDEMIWTFEQLQPDYDWEKQYESGKMDVEWVPSEEKDANGKPISHQMRPTERDTFKIDMEGRAAHDARIQRGLCLFGKYYRGLWD